MDSKNEEMDPPMTRYDKAELGREIIKKAQEFGASLAGIANIKELKQSPSHTISEKMTPFGGVGIKKVQGRKEGQVVWPENAGSAVVIAVEHPGDAPDMDWWVKGLKGGTKGNARLMAVFDPLAGWLESEKQIPCIKLPYHVEHGAVFMKDTAVLGGLGCIGKNNILVTPEFGPRVRLRVMLLEMDLPSTGVLDFDPCRDCKEHCRKACPQKAFNETLYSAAAYGQDLLPGRTGVYSRHTCNREMEKNTANGTDVPIEGTDKTGRQVKFCRLCELACPVGRKSRRVSIRSGPRPEPCTG